MTPYTYLIGWSQHDRWYYGCRYSKSATPAEFWVTYFTHSKYVREMRLQKGEPDIVQIRKIFRTADDCRRWEHKVLRRMRRNIGRATTGELNPMFGKHHSEATRRKCTPHFTPEHRAAISEKRRLYFAAMTPEQRKRPEETKRKISQTQQRRYAEMTQEQRKQQRKRGGNYARAA